MAYTLANLENDIRNYTEVDSTVFSSAILNPIIKNAEKKISKHIEDIVVDKNYNGETSIVTESENISLNVSGLILLSCIYCI